MCIFILPQSHNLRGDEKKITIIQPQRLLQRPSMICYGQKDALSHCPSFCLLEPSTVRSPPLMSTHCQPDVCTTCRYRYRVNAINHETICSGSGRFLHHNMSAEQHLVSMSYESNLTAIDYSCLVLVSVGTIAFL